MNAKILKVAATILPSLAALILAGCWTPPNANVQPVGEPRLIQSGLQVESVKAPAMVQAVNAGGRALTLKLPDNTTAVYQVATSVDNLGSIQVNDTIAATVTETLDVYLLANGRLSDGATAQSLGVNAKVLQVDPSYRLLTLQYPGGQSEKFKMGLEAKLLEMAPGDSVVVRPGQVTKIRMEKP